MGVLSLLLGKDNPAAMWAQQNRGWKSALGAGLAAGPTFEQGLANAAQMGPQGQQADDAYRVAEEEKAERAAQINQTAKYLADTFPDLAEAVNAGMPLDSAWNEAMKRKQPGYGVAEPTKMEFRDVNGDIIGLNSVTGDSRVVYDGPAATPSMPTSYQEFELAQRNPDYAASLSSSTSKPPTEGERRNQQLSSVIEPELKIVEDNWDALTNAADQTNANFGRAATSPAYQAAADSLKTIAQSYLYSISGQAATDSETEKIVSSLTPVFGESKASADNKKARVRRMVEAVKAAGGRAAPAGGAADPMGIR